ncbi:MAG: hypothetical protein WBM13_04280 [Bacteroidia bacterium]
MFSSGNTTAITKIRYYFGFFIVGLYLIIGLGFLFTDIGIQMFPVYRQAVGAIMIVYGTFRVYSLIKSNKKREEEN